MTTEDWEDIYTRVKTIDNTRLSMRFRTLLYDLKNLLTEEAFEKYITKEKEFSDIELGIFRCFTVEVLSEMVPTAEVVAEGMHGQALEDYGSFTLKTGGDQLDFFDSVGIIIGIKPEKNYYRSTYFFNLYVDVKWLGSFSDRKQATKEAIKHATEAYNEQFK